MTKTERLKKITSTATQQLTEDDKNFIKATSAEMGVEFTPKKRCGNCYIDQAVILWHKMNQPTPAEGRKWSLVGGRVFYVNGRRYSDDTITDADAEELMEMGFPKYWFKANEDK